jgi:DnaK suppressor protein
MPAGPHLPDAGPFTLPARARYARGVVLPAATRRPRSPRRPGMTGWCATSPIRDCGYGRDVAVGTGADAREALLAERARAVRRAGALEREFAQLADAASAGGTDDEHDPEGATLAFERQHTAALLDQARAQVAGIDTALERLEAGRYGVCDRCGQPIGADRLAARPAAVTCVRCAALPSPSRGAHRGPFGLRICFFQSVRAW